MTRDTRSASEGGFVLVEALVALAILAFAGTVIYQTGAALLQRVDGDLDRSAAITNLHSLSMILQARGRTAEVLIPMDDGLFRYEFSVGPSEERLPNGSATGFYRATLHATGLATGDEVARLALGYDG